MKCIVFLVGLLLELCMILIIELLFDGVSVMKYEFELMVMLVMLLCCDCLVFDRWLLR